MFTLPALDGLCELQTCNGDALTTEHPAGALNQLFL